MSLCKTNRIIFAELMPIIVGSFMSIDAVSAVWQKTSFNTVYKDDINSITFRTLSSDIFNMCD